MFLTCVLDMFWRCLGHVLNLYQLGGILEMYRPQCHSRSVVASFFGASDRQADYYRYIAEFRSGDEKSKAAEEARKAYADAAKVAKDDLAVTHPIRLGLALNYSVFMYEVLNDPDEACKMARTAFEDKWFKHAKLLNHAETCLIPKSIQNGKGDNKTVVWRCFIRLYTCFLFSVSLPKLEPF